MSQPTTSSGTDTAPLIKVTDIAYVRFRAPNLQKMADFLTDFGMVEFTRTDTALYMRGTGVDPYVHVTELGEPGFIGPVFQVESEQELKTLASACGLPVEQRTEPNGGLVVRLMDPNGFPVEVVQGLTPARPQKDRTIVPSNDAFTKARLNEVKRVGQGSSHVKRLGHCAIGATDYVQSAAWYHRHLGLIKSDEIYIGEKDAVFGAFMRCDRGDMPVDHHTLFIVGTGTPGFNHAAWEVSGIDDLMLGHEVLVEKEHTPVWGVGRHILGSQVFDYWQDPWGNKVEHWTDGDLFAADHEAGLEPVDVLMNTQWGKSAPPEMA